MSYKSVLQECPRRVSHKSVLQECPTRVSHQSVPQECPRRVSHKSSLQECPTRVSQKSVPRECPTRVFAFGFVGSILFKWTFAHFQDPLPGMVYFAAIQRLEFCHPRFRLYDGHLNWCYKCQRTDIRQLVQSLWNSGDLDGLNQMLHDYKEGSVGFRFSFGNPSNAQT